MTSPRLRQPMTESEFAAAITALGADTERRATLVSLLEETHALYDERGAAATVRMRGWVLSTLAQPVLSDAALVHMLEELESGRDPYLVAVAANALRRYPRAEPAFASYLTRAIANVRQHDDLVSLTAYGGYVDDEDDGTTAVAEALATLRWMGASAAGARQDLELLAEDHRRGELPTWMGREVDAILSAIRDSIDTTSPETECCALPGPLGRWWTSRDARRDPTAAQGIVLEDQQGERLRFDELFVGKPSFVVFFYTRCDNPRKCSLSIAKLATLQRAIDASGLSGQVRTAAITYDPAWDVPDRLLGYARQRGVRLDADHRMLRSDPASLPVIQRHFGLGVNYVESLVNRHRVEAFVTDATGRVAATFARLEWNDQEVVDRLRAVVDEASPDAGGARAALATRDVAARGRHTLSAMAPLASVGAAFIPKCLACWATYLSMVGVAGLERWTDTSWLRAGLLAVLAINLASLWVRARASGEWKPLHLGAAGASLILVATVAPALAWARIAGVALTIGASLLTVRIRPSAARSRQLARRTLVPALITPSKSDA